MKRGLKGFFDQVRSMGHLVTTIAPMKRGLKAARPRRRTGKGRRYNHCPDEKGTESKALYHAIAQVFLVTTIAPMKRGLKVFHFVAGGQTCLGVTTIAPMKRGLKGRGAIAMEKPAWCYNHCPDEKGTESLTPPPLIHPDPQLQPLPR